MKRFASTALAVLGLAATSGVVAAAGRPIIVELFTSQGCSSCPPANANLIEISRRPDVLALSFAVTYWDRLGWKDIFGKPEFTARQYDYEPALGESGPFTPQIVVEGRNSAVGANLQEVEALIAAQQAEAGPLVHLGKERANIGAGKAPEGGADVWLVRYEPEVINVPVKRGENSDRTLPHGHVVRSLTRIGGWSGMPADFTFAAPAGGLRTAILLQRPKGGPILAAATD
ncbi:hypothetical protein CCR94_02610 [Rhodoblastus sphagnicola]|uniref:DUF1223 domain-containing protein n=1 Tax=Rhodoblastus sphagnicola TaxID=333368 RepID=A0A2S6NF02_9HYPH|nr:DUF1223 domain-containing protein [Rhodoblastus sphagnicola]MBB4200499.1 hypothetical protein [Rhodoblastus sphagnicola]PPQ33149.1 hypothetical protein CCR94_02610 [Rhodoblastus sphagnicola]